MELNEILNVLNNEEGMTITAIAKSIGLSKPTDKLKRLVGELVDGGKVSSKDEDGRVRYFKGNTIERSEEIQGIFEFEELSNSVEVKGYTISEAKHEGKRIIKIDTPNGETIRTSRSSMILIITDPQVSNSTRVFKIKIEDGQIKPILKKVLDSVFEFRTVYKYVSSVTKDIRTDKIILEESDIKLQKDHLMLFNIGLYHKAAK